ncbi:hypothetical protein AFLA_008047 [Aspergillus flavus NRRL3357]|nr:hypothetical protein AFLA_008047 [Aspergillus flavus NRRL3357]
MRPKVTPRQWKQRTENRNGAMDGPHQTIDWNGRNVPKCLPSGVGVQRSKLIRAVARASHSVRAVDPSCENYLHCLIFL